MSPPHTSVHSNGVSTSRPLPRNNERVFFLGDKREALCISFFFVKPWLLRDSDCFYFTAVAAAVTFHQCPWDQHCDWSVTAGPSVSGGGLATDTRRSFCVSGRQGCFFFPRHPSGAAAALCHTCWNLLPIFDGPSANLLACFLHKKGFSLLGCRRKYQKGTVMQHQTSGVHCYSFIFVVTVSVTRRKSDGKQCVSSHSVQHT